MGSTDVSKHVMITLSRRSKNRLSTRGLFIKDLSDQLCSSLLVQSKVYTVRTFAYSIMVDTRGKPFQTD